MGRAVGAVLACLVVVLAAGCAKRADVAHGRQLATVLGCISCHGPALDGHLFQDEPQIAVIYSANASLRLRRYDDAGLERMLRTGRRADGSMLFVMPPASFSVLDEADMRDLIGYLRTVPPHDEDHPPIVIGPLMRRALDSGRYKPPAGTLAQDRRRQPVDLGLASARGRYLARTVCAECHQPDLTGEPDPRPGDAPDLAIAAAYDLPAFRTLLRTGRGRGGRDLGWMSEAARERLYALSDADIAALHAYLVARAER